MPNWVKNVVTFDCSEERIKDIREAIKGNKDTFDFNKLIPMPESLKLTEGSRSDRAEECYKAFLMDSEQAIKEKYKLSDEAFEKLKKDGEIYASNREKYGHRSWYDWAIENWGTKWNASETYWNTDNIVTFETAWSCPIPIFEKLSEMYPDVKFEVAFADEDIGNNCGVLVYENGRGEEISCFDEESAEKFAESIWDGKFEFEGE